MVISKGLFTINYLYNLCKSNFFLNRRNIIEHLPKY